MSNMPVGDYFCYSPPSYAQRLARVGENNPFMSNGFAGVACQSLSLYQALLETEDKKMQYTVTFIQEHDFTVEADSEEEAQEKAYQKFCDFMRRPVANTNYDEVRIEREDEE